MIYQKTKDYSHSIENKQKGIKKTEGINNSGKK